MHIPTHFYYDTPRSEGADYGMTQTGILSVRRMLANNPYWQKPFAGFDKNPKTLIINMSEKQSWESDQLSVLSFRLQDLQKKGFKIYLWEAGYVHLIAKIGNLSDELPKFDDYETSDKIVIEAAIKQLQLTFDEILVLNADELRLLMLGGEGDWPESTDFKNINLKNSCMSTKSLDYLFKAKGELIESLNLSGCILDKSILAEMPILPHLKQLVLYEEPNEGRYQSEYSLNPQSIAQLITCAPNLNSLYLHEVNYVDLTNLNTIFANLSLSLQEFTLSSARNFKLEWLSKLASTKIKKLCFHRCAIVGDFPPGLDLNYLEEIELRKVNTSANALMSLLSAANHLIKLKLDLDTEITGKINQSFSSKSL